MRARASSWGHEERGGNDLAQIAWLRAGRWRSQVAVLTPAGRWGVGRLGPLLLEVGAGGRSILELARSRCTRKTKKIISARGVAALEGWRKGYGRWRAKEATPAGAERRSKAWMTHLGHARQWRQPQARRGRPKHAAAAADLGPVPGRAGPTAASSEQTAPQKLHPNGVGEGSRGQDPRKFGSGRRGQCMPGYPTNMCSVGIRLGGWHAAAGRPARHQRGAATAPAGRPQCHKSSSVCARLLGRRMHAQACLHAVSKAQAMIGSREWGFGAGHSASEGAEAQLGGQIVGARRGRPLAVR